MSDAEEGPLTVAEFVEYCRTQARLLAGRAETLSDEVGDLLDEIDDEIATARDRLESSTTEAAGTVSPESASGPESDGGLADVEELGEELETKQAVVEAKQARLGAFQDLAASYTDLAAELDADVDDGQVAMKRVVSMEADADAPAYFPDRKTVAEAAADAAGSGDESDDGRSDSRDESHDGDGGGDNA